MPYESLWIGAIPLGAILPSAEGFTVGHGISPCFRFSGRPALRRRSPGTPPKETV
jgi:hypothetical protein